MRQASSLLVLVLACGAGGPVRAQPAAPPPTAARAAAAREAGRLDEAQALYRQALEASPGWTAGWWGLGTIAYERNAWAEAATAFGRLIALDPKNGTAHLMLALCEYELHRDTSALAHIEEAKRLGVQKDGDLPQVLAYHEGMLLLRAARYEAALEALQPLAASRPDDPDLQLALGLGVLLLRPQAAPPDGDPARILIRRAGAAERLRMVREFPAAANAYRALVAEAPSLANVHYAYGRFLLATDDLDAAVAEFERELARQPAHVRARMQIGAARYRLNPAAAVPVVQEVVTLEPGYPFGHFLLGLLYLESGDTGRAIPELEIAARMVPGEAQFQFTLGNAYARAGRKEDAARARAAFQKLKGEAVSGDGPRLDLDGATRGAPPRR